ncbi:unnamed protein product [Schistocephalus solidus]|uniref:Uncharacterized protein n=1 Tax=Schistocephalus solidus TaxID=70667 RepID=A0A183TP95_SCHSO|nr:unnamed protein product [Schistocephalus solidus]
MLFDGNETKPVGSPHIAFYDEDGGVEVVEVKEELEAEEIEEEEEEEEEEIDVDNSEMAEEIEEEEEEEEEEIDVNNSEMVRIKTTTTRTMAKSYSKQNFV